MSASIWKANVITWREARGRVVERAGGWPRGWLDTAKEAMKVRLSSAIHMLLRTLASRRWTGSTSKTHRAQPGIKSETGEC